MKLFNFFKSIKEKYPNSKIAIIISGNEFIPYVSIPEIDFIIFGDNPEDTFLELSENLDKPLKYSSILGLAHKTGKQTFFFSNRRVKKPE